MCKELNSVIFGQKQEFCLFLACLVFSVDESSQFFLKQVKGRTT